MKKVFSTVLFFFLISFTYAQQKYRVTYNYSTEEIKYYKLSKTNLIEDTLTTPKFKRNSLIELKLININPFAVSVKTDVKEETVHPTSNGFNFSSLLGGINSFSGENLNLKNLTGSMSSFDENGKSRGNTSSRGSKIRNKFSDLNEKFVNVDAIKSVLMANLLNPNINKKQIIKNLKEVSSELKDSRLVDPNNNYYLFLYKLNNLIKEDAKDIENDISLISEEIENNLETDKKLSRGELVLKNNAFQNLNQLILSLNEKGMSTSSSLNQIKDLYTSLEASNFEQTYDYIIESDKVDVELKFIQSEFSEEVSEETNNNVIKTRHLKLFAKGGFKINTSVALTLNNFGSNSKDFFIDSNGFIGQDINNHSVPNLSTMINFYPVMGENFNIGGSFGVSVPISGESRGINFLLGPTIFLGNKSRVSFSGGLAYGTVNKLTNGLKVGDTTNFNDIDSFTKSVYDFGYYFGISFSLFEIN